MLTMLHAENGDVIDVLVKKPGSRTYHARMARAEAPGLGAVEASLRAAALSAQTGAPLVTSFT